MISALSAALPTAPPQAGCSRAAVAWLVVGLLLVHVAIMTTGNQAAPPGTAGPPPMVMEADTLVAMPLLSDAGAGAPGCAAGIADRLIRSLLLTAAAWLPAGVVLGVGLAAPHPAPSGPSRPLYLQLGQLLR